MRAQVTGIALGGTRSYWLPSSNNWLWLGRKLGKSGSVRVFVRVTKIEVVVWLYSSGGVCCSVAVYSKEQNMENIVCTSIKYFYKSV